MNLSPVERFVWCLSRATLRSFADACEDFGATGEWEELVGLAARHGFAGHVGFFLAELRRAGRPLPRGLAPELAHAFERTHLAATARDLRNHGELERWIELAAAHDVRCAVVKGLVAHASNASGTHGPARGSADLDVLVFGGREGLGHAARVLGTAGYRYRHPRFRTFDASLGRTHDHAFVKEVGEGEVLAIDLHSAPSCFHVGPSGASLVAWFATQGREIPWTSAATGRQGRMFTLSDEGTFLMAVINAFKDECVRIRDLADVARLCELHGATIDWDAIAAVARANGMTALVGSALDAVAGAWPDTVLAFPPTVRTTFVGSPALAPYLTARAVVRSPALVDSVPADAGAFLARTVRRAAFQSVFGAPAVVTWWVAKLKRSVPWGRGGERAPRSVVRGSIRANLYEWVTSP